MAQARVNDLTKENQQIKTELNKLQGRPLVEPHWKGRDFTVDNDLFFVDALLCMWSNEGWEKLKEIVASCGMRLERADEKSGRIIMDDVWEGICRARLVIADITGNNPNVMYEIGLADVLGKELIPLTQDPVTSVASDFLGIRLIPYENTIKGARELTENLTKRFKKIKAG